MIDRLTRLSKLAESLEGHQKGLGFLIYLKRTVKLNKAVAANVVTVKALAKTSIICSSTREVT